MTANGTKFAKLLETKRFRGTGFEHPQDVMSALLPLALGKLTGGRRRLAIERIDDEGAVSDGPNISRAAKPHVRFGEQPPLFLRRRQMLHERSSGIAHSANDSAAPDELPTLQTDSIRGGQAYSCVKHNFYTGFFHFPAGELSELGADLRQDLVARVDEHDFDVFTPKVSKITRAAADQIVYFAGSLRAAETAAYDAEGQIRFALFSLGTNFRSFHLLHQVRTQCG